MTTLDLKAETRELRYCPTCGREQTHVKRTYRHYVKYWRYYFIVTCLTCDTINGEGGSFPNIGLGVR